MVNRDNVCGIVDDNVMAKLDTFVKLLQEWGKVHNLTSELDGITIWKNILDSIAVVPHLPKFDTALDIGTGAGFPGLILAAAYEDKKFVLAEPRKKRASFLKVASLQMGLKNVEVKAKRVEEIEPFCAELITSRAVTDTNMLIELSKEFICEGTNFLFYKGSSVNDEIKNFGEDVVKVINDGNRNYLLIKGDKI